MMKRLFIVSLILMLNAPAFAEVKLEELEELNIRPPAYRVGLTDEPEKNTLKSKQNHRLNKQKPKLTKSRLMQVR